VSLKRMSIAMIGICAMLLIGAPYNDLVQCIGDDGHVEIERSNMGNCSSWHGLSELPEFVTSIPSTKTSHCGICVDIPLDSSIFTVPENAKQDADAPNHTESWGVSVANKVLHDRGYRFPVVDPPVIERGRIQQLRTVVLII